MLAEADFDGRVLRQNQIIAAGDEVEIYRFARAHESHHLPKRARLRTDAKREADEFVAGAADDTRFSRVATLVDGAVIFNSVRIVEIAMATDKAVRSTRDSLLL